MYNLLANLLHTLKEYCCWGFIHDLCTYFHAVNQFDLSLINNC